MSRRRKRERGGYSPPPEYRSTLPVSRYKPRAYLTPLYPYRGSVFTPSSASPTLDHPARPRTVRPLIRTVLTDTHPRNQTRAHLNVSRRAVFRGRTPVNPWDPDSFHSSGPLYERNFICARRSIRREVLFALKATGRGAGAPRRRTEESKVRC